MLGAVAGRWEGRRVAKTSGGRRQAIDTLYIDEMFNSACTPQPPAWVSRRRPVRQLANASEVYILHDLHRHLTPPHHRGLRSYPPPRHPRLRSHPPRARHLTPQIEEPRQ